MSWTSGTFFAYDSETTGVDVRHDRVVTATVVKFEAGRHVDERSWLINPGIEIPEGATAVHGITTERARAEGTDPADGLEAIADMLARTLRAGYPLAVMNAAYDLSILEYDLRRHDLQPLQARVSPDHWWWLIDPFVLARGLDTVNRAFRKGRRYKLPDLCERYRVPFTESHDATADAVGAGLVAAAIYASDPYIDRMGPGALFQAQQTWRREDQRRFAEWVVSSGKEAEYGDIDTGWPFHSSLAEQAVSA